LPESNASPKERLLEFYGRAFGVPEEDLSPLCVTEKGAETWVASAELPPEVHTRRPPGLRALRWMPDGPKPTSAFLSALGERIRRARIDLDLATLRALLLGRRVPVALPDSYVALSHRGLVLGCGRVQRSELHALMPTGRRRELLEVLENPTPPKTAKL
jgi:NOL1/NOP2/fmu family ribosome biogenesis protein